MSGLQGCSLLFVAKGKTGMASVRGQEAPKAVSLSKKMSRTNVVHYTVEAGDTLDLIAQMFYGDTEALKKLARFNGLRTTSKLKPGRVLGVPDPAYYPNKDDFKRQRKVLLEQGRKATATPGAAPVFSQKDEEGSMPFTKIARPKANHAFASGEKLTYEVRALSMVAGQASLEVDDFVNVSGRPCYPLTARAKAAFPFSAIYPVQDVQTSYFDAVDFLSWKFENNVSEGNYKARNLELYDQVKHRLVRRHNDEKPEEMDVPPFAQDIISCFYYFRLFPIELGGKYSVPTSSGGKNYNLVVKVLKREKITIPLGTFDCYLLKPFVKQGTVFRNSEDINMWVTADSRHVPVFIKSGIVIGSIEISLIQAILPEMTGVPASIISR
jgi:LysM repeat protein